MTIPAGRGVYCNRTLNLRSIRAVGYDMDYTLIHYRSEAWEERAYERVRAKLGAAGWPVADLRFDPELVIRGLVLDVEQGNVVKANRFGYVKRAAHGTALLSFEEQRRLYSRSVVDLAEDRWVFLNTLFSLSEACMYAQLVDRLDAGELPGVLGYRDLYARVRASIDEAHTEGELKAEIMTDPARYVELDPEAPQALLDQRDAGKRLLLITNSDWTYTQALMHYAFDPFLPPGATWRDLFDLVIVSARKPAFFEAASPVFEVVSEDGLLRPVPRGIARSGVYLGGDAATVEAFLGVSGDEILYVGDHLYTDVHASKNTLSWRTALVLRELEQEIACLERFRPREAALRDLMDQKERLEAEACRLRLAVQRKRSGGPGTPKASIRSLERRLGVIRTALGSLDERIAPLATEAARLSNPRWGLLFRAGNDKSYLARQVERYADIYTSRVSNFLYQTPFAFLRAPRGSLPHDDETRRLAMEEEELQPATGLNPASTPRVD